MMQQDLLGQLRDIHLPTTTIAAPAPGYALWPLIVFALALGAVLGAEYWRRTSWRRQARAALRTIEADRDRAQRWSSLVMLAVQMARISGRPDMVPSLAYKNPLVVTDEEAAALCTHLRREMAR